MTTDSAMTTDYSTLVPRIQTFICRNLADVPHYADAKTRGQLARCPYCIEPAQSAGSAQAGQAKLADPTTSPGCRLCHNTGWALASSVRQIAYERTAGELVLVKALDLHHERCAGDLEFRAYAARAISAVVSEAQQHGFDISRKEALKRWLLWSNMGTVIERAAKLADAAAGASYGV